MSKINKFKKGNGIKSVTLLPGFILKLKGRADSKKGRAAADACIAKYMSRCAAIENSEVITAEGILFNDRRDAAVTLTALSDKLKDLDDAPAQKEAKDVFSIRENKRNASQMNSARLFVSSSLKKLSVINVNIINIDTILDERIAKTREKTASKINAYVAGLRRGVLTDYEANLAFSDEARNIYRSKHSDGDELIKQAMVIHKEG